MDGGILFPNLPVLPSLLGTTKLLGANAGSGTVTVQQLAAFIGGGGVSPATTLAGLTSTAPFTGAVARDAQQKAADHVSALDFGAKGDGATDDAAAIQLALNTGRSVFLPGKRSYVVGTGLNFTANGQRLFSEGGQAWHCALDWTGSGAVITGLGLQHCVVEGLHIRRKAGAAALTTGHAVAFGANGSGVGSFGCEVRRCRIQGTGNGISMACTEGRVTDCHFRDLGGAYAIRFYGWSAAIRSYRAVISNCIGDFDTKPVVAGFDWVVFDSYAYSLVVEKCAWLNAGGGLRMTDSVNSGTSFPIWLFCWDLEVDHNIAYGVRLEAGEGAYIGTSWIGSCLQGNGLVATAAWRGELGLVNTRFMGNKQHGLLLDAGVDALVSNCFAGDNSAGSAGTYHGICVAAGVSRFALLGNKLGDLVGVGGNAQGYGLFITAGASDQYQVLGNLFGGNTTGTVFDGGTGQNKLVQTGAYDFSRLGVASSGDAFFSLRKAAAGQSNLLEGYTGTLKRWDLQLGSGAAEGGGNAGSNFGIRRYADDGTFLDVPWSIARETGVVAQLLKAAAMPAANGQMCMELTSNTSLTVRVRGSDGTVRSAVLALAP